ncbi:hypothetical protein NX722_18830 [Endozoicomonas gorgoniicola]|uniref:Uncharacterized protein n=1 Tax=Endozoicomonas gorgoniicola TaxID=1234144 RepID=A0ABT3MZ31_9GAMM|nr:hypothetical protein [Endozoicomonas gorgoniicola]MCW7554636.1 hypothetical protein [Endozoicomonas gorgoniicola]
MRHAQQYMRGLSDYANRILNIDHRFQVYALTGTRSSESSASDPLDRFNLNEPSNRTAGPALLGFVILRSDESGSITDSYLLELAFDTGNANEPTFRQRTNYGDNDNQAVVETFNNPLCLRSSTTSESHSPILSLDSPDLESAVRDFIRDNSHRGSRRSSDSRSRSSSMASSSSGGSYYSGDYEVPVGSNFIQREGSISQPINIPARTGDNPNRNARRKENYGQWSASSSAHSSLPDGHYDYAYGFLPEGTFQDTRSGSTTENLYSEVSDQNQEASGKRKKEKWPGILNRLQKANKADTKAANKKTTWHLRNPRSPLPMPPVPTPDQLSAELPIPACQRRSESDCILYEPAAPAGNGTEQQQNPNPPAVNGQENLYDPVIIVDTQWQ